MLFFNHAAFQFPVKVADASKLFDSMKEELLHILHKGKWVYSKQFPASRYKEKERLCLWRKRYDVAKYAGQCDTTTAIRKF